MAKLDGTHLALGVVAAVAAAGALTQRAPAAPWAVSRAPRTRDCSPPALPTQPGALYLFAERHRWAAAAATYFDR
jgi:hypothetical protein